MITDKTVEVHDVSAGELYIGVSNNDHGVHISIMQRHADGRTIAIYSAKAPAGDSFGRAALAGGTSSAKAELPAEPTDAVLAACGWEEWKQEGYVNRSMAMARYEAIRAAILAATPASDAWKECADCEGTARISPDQLCARCEASGILPATPASDTLTAEQIAAGAAVLGDDGKPIGRNVAIMVADAMRAGASDTRAAVLEEAARLFDGSPHAEQFHCNIAEQIRDLKGAAAQSVKGGEA
jgi:hypothetical protein